MVVRRLGLPLSLLCLSLGCSTGADDGDAESAAEGWRAASAAMQQAAADFDAEVEPGDTDRIDVSCPEGGTIILDGGSTDEGFDFTISFDACGTQGVRIEGELSYTGQATASSLEFEYVGELSFSGAVDLTCTIDMSGKTSTTIEGMNVSAEAELRGSICGQQAEAVASVGN